MDISVFFKSIIDADNAPVVICNNEHKIVYMNPAAVSRYEQYGGASLIGNSLLNCHNSESNNKIERIIEWFSADKSNNKVYTYHNEKENKDVYMIALRDDNSDLIGYYEKHEYRECEKNKLYDLR